MGWTDNPKTLCVCLLHRGKKIGSAQPENLILLFSLPTLPTTQLKYQQLDRRLWCVIIVTVEIRSSYRGLVSSLLSNSTTPDCFTFHICSRQTDTDYTDTKYFIKPFQHYSVLLPKTWNSHWWRKSLQFLLYAALVLVSLPLWSRMKYLNNHWVDYHEFSFKKSWSSEDDRMTWSLL